MILSAAGHDSDHLVTPSDLYNPTLGRPFEDGETPRRYRSAPQESAAPFRAFTSADDAADTLAAVMEAARLTGLPQEYLRNETPPIVVATPDQAAKLLPSAPTPPPPPVVQIHALRHQRKLQLPPPPSAA
jgi:hypothetical protein